MNFLSGLIKRASYRNSYRKPNKPWRDPRMDASSRQKSSYLHIGVFGAMFASCFAAIPLYRLFCQHVGIIGNYDKKEYDFQGKKISNMKKYRVIFKGQGQPDINWTFEPVQNEVYVNAAETAIMFYKVYNKEDFPIIGFSTYTVTPEEANIYFSKIQCFCFNQQLINPKEQLLLPLFFYLEPEINDDPNVSRINQLTIDYRFYRSDKQDLAKHVEQQLKTLEMNRKALAKIRAKKAGMSLEQYLLQNPLEESATETRLHAILQETPAS